MADIVKRKNGVYTVNFFEAELEQEADYVELTELWIAYPEHAIKIEKQMSYIVDKEDDYDKLCIWWKLLPAYSVPAQQIAVRMSILNSRELKNIEFYQTLIVRLENTPTKKQQKEIEARICEIISNIDWFDENKGVPTFFRYYLTKLDKVPSYQKKVFLEKVNEIVLG